MTDPRPWMLAVRSSHDRLAALIDGLAPGQLASPSYDSEWTVAQVLSHLGGQAEYFALVLDAGLTGDPPPGPAAMPPIWDRWNARAPEIQASESVAANERLVRRLESLDASALHAFHVSLFGAERDVVGLMRLRLGEHAVHTWDVAVTLDPAATVAGDAVQLLIDHLPEMVGRVGRPAPRALTLAVSTSDPDRRFTLAADGVRLDPWTDQVTGGSLRLPAEALFRLVHGRLDPAHTPPLQLDAPGVAVDDLRAVFPGF